MTPQLRLRPASPEDRDALGALKLRSSLAWGDHIDELLALPEARQVPAAHLPFIVVAELAGKVVGFATILPENEDFQAELEDMFVAPAAWRKGVGRQLLDEAESRAVARGARFVRVVAGERARPFYEACGYRVIGTAMTTFAPALEMHKDLRQTRGARPDGILYP
ncbi:MULTISPECIES: GNAT family N-acetyltransferase [Phyllobacteriaceae]|uniref:GNAT family N-acetyltransferase n=1 Tax=Phyllobacteriaceae TaxID=69277 RepID=UPI002ACA1B5E|nr:GNAT family N-acetyltransferase [Chelativorans sp. M5D2P16]MDZ5700075.1 GNAT family N-acetyltransferase [Chelativorans sp. M5D2P16]